MILLIINNPASFTWTCVGVMEAKCPTCAPRTSKLHTFAHWSAVSAVSSSELFIWKLNWNDIMWTARINLKSKVVGHKIKINTLKCSLELKRITELQYKGVCYHEWPTLHSNLNHYFKVQNNFSTTCSFLDFWVLMKLPNTVNGGFTSGN